jgi:hypothetical protein
MAEAMESQVFDHVGKDFFAKLCHRQHFEPIDLPAERHGSWEWTFRKRAGGLERFVLIAFTNLPTAVPDSDWYAVELWAGAEKGARYTRKPVSDFHAEVRAPYQQQLRSALKEPLLRAMSIAGAFTVRDLDDAYVGPRAHLGQEPDRHRDSGS